MEGTSYTVLNIFTNKTPNIYFYYSSISFEQQ